ncbi:hypothetical protein L596_005571 [Steinernema carpocapsae]|uniref:Uncharacterized protein n=1 Tax=Steinernema carpocapsae TaxID=34508 RepID=A0A4U8UZE5_STECR|nr:hypothetical protein L596_005571 [Steinernema carpocapsae]
MFRTVRRHGTLVRAVTTGYRRSEKRQGLRPMEEHPTPSFLVLFGEHLHVCLKLTMDNPPPVLAMPTLFLESCATWKTGNPPSGNPFPVATGKQPEQGGPACVVVGADAEHARRSFRAQKIYNPREISVKSSRKRKKLESDWEDIPVSWITLPSGKSGNTQVGRWEALPSLCGYGHWRKEFTGQKLSKQAKFSRGVLKFRTDEIEANLCKDDIY